MNDKVQKILAQASRAHELSAEFRSPLIQRYKRFILNTDIFSKGPRIDRLLGGLNTLQGVLAAVGAALGFFLIYTTNDKNLHLAIWIGYVVVASVVAYIVSIIPTDFRLLNSELEKLRLLNLCERLAAQVALFDLLYKENLKELDDEATIQKFSNFLPLFTALTPEDQSTIRRCLDQSQINEKSRETNVKLPLLELDSNTQNALSVAVKEVVELCGYLFVGSNFSAKVYLRTKLQVESEQVELLTPFSKYPASPPNSRGSGWVKDRANSSIVWQALESGRPKQVTEKNLGAYYASVLAIPLPRRIGVLAITSSEENAFRDKDDLISTRALSVAMAANVLQTLSDPN